VWLNFLPRKLCDYDLLLFIYIKTIDHTYEMPEKRTDGWYETVKSQKNRTGYLIHLIKLVVKLNIL
jgi:hypothetical protein